MQATHTLSASVSFCPRGRRGRGGERENTDVGSSSIWGLLGPCDSALGQTGLGVAAAAVQLILTVTIGDSPQTAKATSSARPWGQ